MRYTIIHHSCRKELGISMNDYCIADAIYHLSNNPGSKLAGWCYATKQTLADELGISKVWVVQSIANLEAKGILEKSEDGRLLRTTKVWYDYVIMDDLTDGKGSLPNLVNGVNQLGKGSLPPSKNKKKEIEKEKIIYPFNDLQFINKWEEWKQYRKEMKFPFKSVRSEQQSLKELGRYTMDQSIRAIEISIANGWRGLFPDKVQEGEKFRGQTRGQFVQ